MYCQNTLTATVEEVKILNESNERVSILLCKKQQDEKIDFSNEIDGLIIYPLLGQRFTKLMANAVKKSGEKEQGNQETQPNADTVDTAADITVKEKTILVVEDNLINQKVASLLLAKEGYIVALANDGKEAVDMVKAQSSVYSLILMDCMMPIMDGFAATEAIREWEQDQTQKRLPIIALTASVFVEDIDKCYQSGMDDYVAKPFKKEIILEKLEAYT